MTLFQIAKEIQALHDFLSDIDGDVTEFESEIDKWLDDTKDATESKVDAYGGLIREFEARAEARNAEAARIASLADFDAAQAERLKKRLKTFMEMTKNTKIETLRFKIAVQKNGGKAPLHVPEEWEKQPAYAPEKYHRHRLELDKEQIRVDLEAGKTVDGCAIGERGTHLRIK